MLDSKNDSFGFKDEILASKNSQEQILVTSINFPTSGRKQGSAKCGSRISVPFMGFIQDTCIIFLTPIKDHVCSRCCILSTARLLAMINSELL